MAAEACQLINNNNNNNYDNKEQFVFILTDCRSYVINLKITPLLDQDSNPIAKNYRLAQIFVLVSQVKRTSAQN